MNDETPLLFCSEVLKFDEPHYLTGSHLVYTRQGRFNPSDLHDIIERITVWCGKHAKQFSLNFNGDSTPFWRVVISGDISSQADTPQEALMDACIFAALTLKSQEKAG